MDLQVCAVLSVLETVGLVGFREHQSLALTSREELLKIFGVFFAVQYTLVKLYRIFVEPVYFSPLRHLPTPKGGHFMLGQLLNQFRAASPPELHIKWASQWPDSPFIRYFGFANTEYLLVNGIDAHREILQTNCYAFKKPSYFYRLVGEIAGTGLLFTEGDEHKKQRRMILNIFSVPNLKKMLPTFQEKADELVDYLERESERSPTGTVELQKAYAKATLDVAGVTSLGVELRNLKSEKLDLDFLQCYKRLLEQGFLSGLISFINVVIPIRRLLWFVEANRGFVEASQEIQSMLRRLINERIQAVEAAEKAGPEAQRPPSRDLLTYMVEERITGGHALTVDTMLGHLRNFISAGHETTAVSLAWASYVMATKPQIQEKLRAEVMELLKEHPVPTYSDIERMRYMNNFVREILRLFAAAVVTHRQAAQDVVICGTRVPKGTNIVFCPPAVNRSTKIWGPDAGEFVPERWEQIDGATNKGPSSAYAIMTFLGGPRQCIGRQYSISEIKAILVRLVSAFRFMPSEQLAGASGDLWDVPLRNPSIILRPKGGIPLRLERI